MTDGQQSCEGPSDQSHGCWKTGDLVTVGRQRAESEEWVTYFEQRIDNGLLINRLSILWPEVSETLVSILETTC